MSAAVQGPQPLRELAPGLSLARGGPGRTLNVYLLGTVIVDSGVRRSHRRLARQLAGRRSTAHMLTHAHFDHAGSSALAFWRERDRVLLCGDVMTNAGLRPERVRLVLPPTALSSDAEENHRSARRPAKLRPRLACFGRGFAVTDPGRFAAAVERLRPRQPPGGR